MRMSMTPIGLPVPCRDARDSDPIQHILRGGKKVEGRLVRPHPAFSSGILWWESLDETEASWWDDGSPVRGYVDALRVNPDGTTKRVVSRTSVPRSVSANAPHECVGLSSYFTVTHIPAARDFPCVYDPSLIGSLLLLSADTKTPMEMRGYVSKTGVRGPVILSSSTRSVSELESLAATAAAWAKAPEVELPNANLAIPAGIHPDAWHLLESTASRLLSEHAPVAMVRSGPLWDTVLTSLMTCLVAGNVSTADELVEQHGTYSALIEHFTVDGEPLDGLLEGTIPRWMRFPANLASGHDKQAPVDTMST